MQIVLYVTSVPQPLIRRRNEIRPRDTKFNSAFCFISKMNHLSRSFPRFPASLSCFRPASVIPATIPSRYHRTVPQRRYSTCTPNPFNGNMSDQPPRHEMVYLPGVISPNRAFGVFRRVLHTGLYSQFVAMEVPVNGEIGDEVWPGPTCSADGRWGHH